MMPDDLQQSRDMAFVRRVLAVLAIGVIALLVWQLSQVLLLIFAAVLFAILLRSTAEELTHRTGIPVGWALLLTVIAVLLVLTLSFMLFGRELQTQVQTLIEQLPQAFESARQRLGDQSWIKPTIDRITTAISSGGIVSGVGGVLGATLGAVADILLTLFGCLYLAAQPRMYERGVLHLFPVRNRQRAQEVMHISGKALRNWLIGQMLAMVAVGLVTGIGLIALGVPSAIALALFAGLAEFVPIIGPIAAAIPAIIIALAHSPTLALWVLGLFLVIQQIEGNIIAPLVQHRMVSLPPALALFTVLAFGLLFGFLGLLLAAPLTVFFYVLVREVYVRDILGDSLKRE